MAVSVVFVVLLVVALALATRARDRDRGPAAPAARGSDAVATVVDQAVLEGILTPEQAAAVRALAARAPAVESEGPTASPSPVIEVLGYVGGLFVAAGAVTLMSQFWDDLGTVVRLALLGSVAVVLTVAGLAVHDEDEPARWRLRGVLLLLASAAVAGFAALMAVDVLDLRPEANAMVIGLAVAVHAGLLWWPEERPAQQLACFGGIVATVAGAATWILDEPAFVGGALWALGGAWLVGGHREILRPGFVGVTLGGLLLLVAAGIAGGQWGDSGVLFGLVTAAGLVAAGTRLDAFMLTAIGVAGSLVYLPATLAVYFGGTIGVPAALLAAGIGLLVVTTRRLRRDGGGPIRSA